MILAGDIGGTKTRLALYAIEGGALVPRVEESYPSRTYATFDTMLSEFLSAHRPRLRAACFGVAGPVRHGHVHTTNLPWVLDAAALGTKLGLARVHLVNDLEATAWGVTVLPASSLASLNAGAGDPHGNAAVIAAGTGLGMAALVWTGAYHEPIASEGGHASLAPRDERDAALLAWLRCRFPHVSRERVLSGQGIVHCYEFLRDQDGGEDPPALAAARAAGDPAAAITAAADTVPHCAAALDLFVGLYGATAGDLALTVMATAGVFVGGGIAPRLVDRLRAGGFMTSFVAKGRMQQLLEAMPVSVVLDDRAALLGAAQCARVREGVG